MYLLVPIFGGAYLGLLKFLPGDLLNFCTVVSFVIVLFNIIIIELEGRRHYQRICHKSDIPKMQKLLKLCVYLKLYLVLPYIAIYFDNSKHVDEESLSYHVSQNPQMIAYLDNNNAKYIFYYEAQDLLLQCFLSIVSLTLLSTICFTIFYSIQIIKVFIHSTPHDASTSTQSLNRMQEVTVLENISHQI
uniref:G_PROTEIN_RECEP_F1_2 domain-containing protein n=1 Tax=Parastrongyloides trichosuri TaxID=131310 RepID=A0A0N4Z576_PARTI